jgi:hypothetical protein
MEERNSEVNLLVTKLLEGQIGANRSSEFAKYLKLY